MSRELIEAYLADSSRRGGEFEGCFSGAAGGAACGDLIRISLDAAGGRIDRVSFAAEGCAAAEAAGAAAAELADGVELLTVARIGPGEIAAALGGLASSHLHAAELAADALARALAALAGSDRPLLAAGRGRVLVALSGGVDSAVAALRERERGAQVVAVTLKLWADRATDGERSCCSPEAVLRARRLAHSLGLAHFTLDLEPGFRAGVVEPFIHGHREGRTPNPCVLCNGELRIDAMIALAERLGAGSLVTGHYARIVDDGEGPLLAAAVDRAKDQAYMLARLRPASLARLRFPLAELRKAEVRELAARAGLEVAGRPESQDLCFLAGIGKQEFLRRHAGLDERPGEIVNRSGEPVGRHQGHHLFTVGQRRGIGVGGGEPMYVLATDAASNRVTVGPRAELSTRRVRLRDARLHRDAGRVNAVRLRYHSRAHRCLVKTGFGGEATVELSESADGVAPGQLACLLDGELVIGHGTIA